MGTAISGFYTVQGSKYSSTPQKMPSTNAWRISVPAQADSIGLGSVLDIDMDIPANRICYLDLDFQAQWPMSVSNPQIEITCIDDTGTSRVYVMESTEVKQYSSRFVLTYQFQTSRTIQNINSISVSFDCSFSSQILNSSYFLYFNSSTFTVPASDEQMTKEITGAIGEQTEEIKDSIEKQTEEQKGFFERLGDRILGGLQAVGNFILDGIKSLFVPEDGYFDRMLKDLNDTLSQGFGFLYYPFDKLIDICQRIIDFNPSDAVISIPSLKYQGKELIPAQTFRFDSVLSGGLARAHDMYLILVDVVIGIGLCTLLTQKLKEVMDK